MPLVALTLLATMELHKRHWTSRATADAPHRPTRSANV
jgi:hypothetical protein